MDLETLELCYYILFYLTVFVFGLVVGSFLNVLIYRIPRGINTVKGRSFCPDCGHALNWLDLFPVFSFIFLRGRCRYCKTRISPRYMFVELSNAFLWLAYAIWFGPTWTTAGYLVFASSLLCIFFTDFEHLLIFDRFNIAIALASVPMFFNDELMWYDRLIGAVAVSGIFLLIGIVSRGNAMGGGDIKFTAAAGLVLGWKNMLLSLFFAALLGGVISVVNNAIKRRYGEETSNVVPLGPYLAVAMIAMSFVGERLLKYYMRLGGITQVLNRIG